MSWNAPQRQAIDKLFLYTKVSKVVKKWIKQYKNSKQRGNILKEWLQTQTSYINDLKIIQNNIQRPLRESQLISDQQERLLFPNITSMINLSENMSKCISETIRCWNNNTTRIGQNLVVFHKFFIIYREYCNNFMKGQEIVKQLKKNAKVIQIQSKLKMDIESYTIKPVQRPPKYQLLLREYQKALWSTHPDYNHVRQAIEKYHEVNEMNNQSMDHQIRIETMIRLDKKFGGIISNRFSRQFLRQFDAVCYNFKCHLYLFSDMLLIVRSLEDKQFIYKRLYLNNTSFIHQRYNFKYFKNSVFVCGWNQSIHLEFQTFADSIYFIERVNQVIMHMLKKEEEKFVLFNEYNQKKKKLAKFMVLNWTNQTKKQISYRINLQIRVKSSIKPGNDPHYFVQFKLNRPYHIIQCLVFTYENLLSIQNYVLDHYKECYLPKIDDRPEHINLVDAAKNKTKLIEYRSFVIEEFLNYFFRNDQFSLLWRYIGEQLGLQLQFLRFAMFEQFDCKCQLCSGFVSNKESKYYYTLMQNSKHYLKSENKSFSVEQIFSPMLSVIKRYGSERQQANRAELKCTTYYFNLLKNIKLAPKLITDSLEERLIAIQSELGTINYTLISLKPPFIPKPNLNLNIKIYLMNVQHEYIELSLNRDMYVRQILQEIAVKNSLRAIYDWSIYIYNEGQFIRIDNDERLIEYSKKLGIKIEDIEPSSSKEDNVVVEKLRSIKKWGQEIFNPKKYRLFMKKHLYFEWNLQLQSCKNNKERYHFVINEMLGRIKFQKIYFLDGELIEFCSLFLLMRELEKMKYCTMDNIDMNPLKDLLPLNCYDVLSQTKFKNDLVHEIHRNIGRLSLKKVQRNAIELIYMRFFDLYKINKEWITKYYKMNSYKTETIEPNILVGINFEECVVISESSRKIIFKTELQNLKYRSTTFSLFLEFEGIEHRFEGKDIWNITLMIQAYLTYNKMYRTF